MPSRTSPLRSPSLQLARALAPHHRRALTLGTTAPALARNDASTIDFMYFPQLTADELSTLSFNYDAAMRVPVLPQTLSPSSPTTSTLDININTAPTDTDTETHRPIINTLSPDSSHISAAGTLSSVHDASSAAHLDFEGMLRARLARGVEEMVDKVEREGGGDVKRAEGIVRQVWKGLLVDLFGEREKGRV